LHAFEVAAPGICALLPRYRNGQDREARNFSVSVTG
jgi:hypothetical protein